MRYEEDEVFPADEFYSFYYYSWQAVKAYQDVLEQVPAEFAPSLPPQCGNCCKRRIRCLKNSMRCTSPRSRKWSL